MGCGASMFHANGEALPVKACLVFLRRIEDIRKRRHPQSLVENLSKKELLLEDDDTASRHRPSDGTNVGKASSSPDECDSCVTSDGSKGASEKPIKEALDKMSDSITRDEIGTITINVNFKGRSRGKGSDVAEQGGKIVEAMDKEEIMVQHSTNGGVQDGGGDVDDDNDERNLRHPCNEKFRCSLSFREYLTENFEDNENEGLEDDLTVSDTAPIDDSTLSKEPVTSEVNKGKKRRSFKMALPKGKPLGVKNILNVRSCMSSANSANYRARLVSAKTPH